MLRARAEKARTQIARHLAEVFGALPSQVTTIQARADSGFYCWEAVEAYEKRGVEFIISARKTSRLVEELKAAEWKRSPRTDADGQCDFRYQPDGWGKPYRFVALRYEKKSYLFTASDVPVQQGVARVATTNSAEFCVGA